MNIYMATHYLSQFFLAYQYNFDKNLIMSNYIKMDKHTINVFIQERKTLKNQTR